MKDTSIEDAAVVKIKAIIKDGQADQNPVMAKITPEQKLIGQIDRLRAKQAGDNALIENLTMENSKISQKSEPEIRKKYNDTLDLIGKISNCVQRRSRALKKKGARLSELRTAELVSQSLS